MAGVDVSPADLLGSADAYAALAARAALIAPQAVVEVQRIAESHGPMGYPTAVGVAAGLASREGSVTAKVADFGVYSQRLSEHAAAYSRADKGGAVRLAAVAWPAGLRELVTGTGVPAAHVDPKPPPSKPAEKLCWIGTEDGDVASLCPPDTDRVSYVDKDNNYVSKDLSTGEITIELQPGPEPGGTSCWLGSRDADRSICGPDTTRWVYQYRGWRVSEVLMPDGHIEVIFEMPPGPVDPN
ncbi:type VII secretion target [Mycobacterium paragordonae]|uniref:Type VII secretion target n=1 Tax=Mycobacterium paragordonae TaxID=1389713 RepID=A0AAJ1W8T4_9MYCO|nr:type VII secretion target [Mycobacterium paragordonae]MDP7739219.1 type VII secretion target [Mycobacterium paragordonae]TDL04006.1 hypothetical protein EUA05_22350 [Mycobacterium paragordonae]